MNKDNKPRLRYFALAIGLSATVVLLSGQARAASPYTASWTSVDTHTPAPEWFKDAKFGIYFHFGVYSVPAYGSEWYPRNMYDKSGNTGHVYSHHTSTFGDPFSNWPYNNFIDGANDKSGKFTQFAPKLTSAGGNWDPDAWAQLFANAGARFVGPSMEHHDGFSMWDSKVNQWNSLDKGPKLNMAKLHVDAYRKKGFRIVAALHTAYHFTGYYQWAPAQTDPALKMLYGQLGSAAENTLWLGKLEEVIDEFQPDILWQDFNLRAVDQTKLLTFLAYYYNAAATWGKEVVATYKDGMNTQAGVYDYERGGPADIVNPYWLTDDAISSSSWCYTTGMNYYSATAIVHAFIDRVSKNGNLLLNISPMADGTIPQAQQDILNTMGGFLKQFGTAIYNTRAWTVYGEGPTKMGGSGFSSPHVGTPSDIRYTTSKDGDALYAIFLGWPGNGKQATLASVTTSAFPVGSGKVFLFGPVGGQATSLSFTQDGSGLHVTMPGSQPYTAVAYALEISKSGTGPAPTPAIQDSGGLVPGSSSTSDGGTVAPPVDAGTVSASGGSPGQATGGTSGSGGISGMGGGSGSGGSPTSSTGGSPSSSGTGGTPTSGFGGATEVAGDSTGGCSCSLDASRRDLGVFPALALLLAGMRAGRRRRTSSL